MNTINSNLIKALVAFFGSSLLVNCGGKMDPNFIGSAIIESQTFQSSSTVPGKILALFKQEGQTVGQEELLAIIDTIPLTLQLQEIKAGLAELSSATQSRGHEIKAGLTDIQGLEKDYSRISPLVKEGALPPQQEDKLSSGLASARLKLSAARDMHSSLLAKKQGLEAKIAQVEEQLHRCYLHAPSAGRILTRYKNLGEAVSPGQPLYEIGREDTLQADFFVPQTELANLKYGQTVRLRLDTGTGKNDAIFLPGTISWISQEAEFSPKNIQTRESRNELVFRIRALAANKDGLLKRGLPIEIWK